MGDSGVFFPAAPSSNQPQKKRLLVAQLDISGGWEKAKHAWEDPPAALKREVPARPPEKAVASSKHLARFILVCPCGRSGSRAWESQNEQE